jgi:isochorismate synthase
LCGHSRLAAPRAVEAGPEFLRASERLRRAADLASRKARALGRSVLAWTTFKSARLDPVALFDCAGGAARDRTLWESPADQFGLVGIGSAWTATAHGTGRFTRVGAAWRALWGDAVGDEAAPAQWGTGPVVMGGFAFAPHGPASVEWRDYPAGVLVLPSVAVASAADASWCTLAVMVAPDARAAIDPEGQVAACLDTCSVALRCAPPASGADAEAAPRLVQELPPAETWKYMVNCGAAAVREGLFKKVVLARAIRIAGDRFDSDQVLRRLRTVHHKCTLFAIARADRCFLGATPERLVRLRDEEVSVAAVAGSAPRGVTEGEEARLGEMLLTGLKDRLEHAAVVNELRDALAEICTTVPAVPRPTLLRVGNIQHLYTPMTGVLRDRGAVLELVDLLHPTAAVGGVPRDIALRWIADHEGLDRGWYAGPVGWMGHAGDGEFSVAIRSALLSPTEALLYAGCGIVARSDPDREYDESLLKLRWVLSALNGPLAERVARDERA